MTAARSSIRRSFSYLDHLAGGGKIIPTDFKARIDALRLQALADGLMDASILIVYEGRYRPAEKHEQKWLDLQAGKIDRALAVLEATPPGLDAPPTIGQITLACALGYREFRFPGTLKKSCPRLTGWLETFAARVPAFEATKPPPASARTRLKNEKPRTGGPGLGCFVSVVVGRVRTGSSRRRAPHAW